MDKYKDQEIKHLVQELKANESLKNIYKNSMDINF